MSDEKTTVKKCPLACVQGYGGSHQEDEVDLKELFLLLWQKKMIIIAVTVLCGLGATVFALTQPKIYNVSSQIRLAVQRENGSDFAVEETQKAIRNEAIAMLQRNIPVGISLNGNKKDYWVVDLDAQGIDPERMYQQVKEYVDTLDSNYKKMLTDQYQIEIDLLKKVLAGTNVTGQTRFVLEEKLAEKIYSAARYKSLIIPSLTIVQLPSLPQVPAKPKVTLIVTMGFLLGAMLGGVSVFIGHIFSRQE